MSVAGVPANSRRPPSSSPSSGASSSSGAGANLAWVDVCALEEIWPSSGAAALVRGKQIALVRVGEGGTIFAISNFDPFSDAFVIARGIVGDRGGRPKIASPIFKQSFDLETGACLDDPAVVLATYPVRVRDGRVEIMVDP